jgi:hypothetical protein
MKTLAIILALLVLVPTFVVFASAGIDWLRDYFNDNSGPGVE